MRFLRTADAAFSVFFVFLVIYLFTLTSNFTGPHDSMAYLNMLKTGHGLWHPHHLLYHVGSKYWLAFWKIFFPGVQDYFLVETFSTVWGSAMLGLLFLFFRRRFGLPVLTAWLGTAVAAFSYGIWFYSVNVEVYMPALFFTLLSLYLLSKKEWTSKQVWLVSLVHSLAILFHQMNILLVPVVLYKIYTQRQNIYVFKSMFWYAVTGLVLVGGMYFLGGWVIEGNRSFALWTDWIRGYTETDAYWQPLSWKTPAFAGLGFLRTIIGGQFLFRLGEFQSGLDTFLKVHALEDEMFLVRNLSTRSLWVILICSFALTALMLIFIVKFIAKFRSNRRTWGHVFMPLFLYVLIYSGYFFFWMPEILEFWLGQCLIFWLLLIGSYRPLGRRLNWMVGGMAVLLFVINYTSSIRPMQDIRNDIGYARIEKLQAVATADDLVIVQNPWLLKEFLEYYTLARIEVIPSKAQGMQELRGKIASTLRAGHRVYIFPDSHAVSAGTAEFVAGLRRDYEAKLSDFQNEISVILVIAP